MTQTTTETTNLDFELVAQAARLVAPVSNGSARGRRILPPPPPPPFVASSASAPLPLTQTARTPSPSDVADLRAWEEAAEQLEPDWATPLDDEDVAEHTAPLVPEVAAEPADAATKIPLIAIEANDSPKTPAQAEDAATSDAIAIVEANLATAPSTGANGDTEKTAADNAPDAQRTEASASTEVESELEALARAVTKNALDTLAARGPGPGRPLPAPPVPSRAPVPPPPPATKSRPLPPLTPAPSRPPASTAFRASPVPPPAPTRAPVRSPVAALPAPRAQLPTLPRMADLEPRPQLAAPSLLEIRNSPVARRFYAQLGVAAVFGALLATILFALVPRQTSSVSVTASQPASSPETRPVPAAVTQSQQAPEARDTIPPPPVANVSVDDLEREPAAEAKPRPKTVDTGLPAAAVPASPKVPAAAPASQPAAPAAPPKPEAAPVAAAKGTLHISAVPAANVAIDGRPLGMTPKIVRLSPGAHRVALIGPGGRRSQTVNVAAGQTATVAVKF